MKRNRILSTLIFTFLIAFSALAGKAKSITVEINYGEQQKTETIQVECTKAMTALEALQHAANVKTHPVANYVFVTGINGVEGVRGDKAWYYTVNGEKPKLAISQTVKAGDTISWRYVKDVCSCTVDKK
ncbi:DUF4430 domain-containing protein [Mangrovibacterium lignilyticum]|uniref:DUF4430 domain-containing protein n=1 Tax=Mangrovibacterium lignilyticum TaxID=2668052 RepID=UPI0013D42285|nr:DUF4430 domain-containing protein [Mangrovibacterium lignilyticum]